MKVTNRSKSKIYDPRSKIDLLEKNGLPSDRISVQLGPVPSLSDQLLVFNNVVRDLLEILDLEFFRVKNLDLNLD